MERDDHEQLTRHELRTPLSTIQLSLEMLLTGEYGALPSESRRLVEMALRNSGRMLRMIGDGLPPPR